MMTDPHDMMAEFNDLDTERLRLSEKIYSVAADLHRRGSPVPRDVIEQLKEYRSRVQRIRSAILGDREKLVLNEGQEDPGLTELQALWRARHIDERILPTLEAITNLRHREVAEFEPLEQARRDAISVRDWMNDPGRDFVTQSPRERELTTVAEGHHPLAMLVELIQSGNKLSDDRWEACCASVADRYGQLLATAAARGKLDIDKKPALVRDVALPVEKPLAKQPAEILDTPLISLPLQPDDRMRADDIAGDRAGEIISRVRREQNESNGDRPVSRSTLDVPQAQESSLVLDQASESVHDDLRAKPNAGILGKQLPQNWRDYVEGQSASETRPPQVMPTPKIVERRPVANVTGTQPQTGPANPSAPVTLGLNLDNRTDDQKRTDLTLLVKRIRHATGAERRSVTSELVSELVRQDQLSLAYHLAKNSEEVGSSQRGGFPSWLIRALLLSKSICYPKGRLAREIEDDFQSFRHGQSDGTDPWSLGTGFLLRASALLPAMACTSKAAEQILQSFRISPGFSQLYNYCTRYAYYCNRLQGHATEIFRVESSDGTWNAEYSELLMSVKSWLRESASKAFQYHRTSPLFVHAHWTMTPSLASQNPEAVFLWKKWQETLLLTHRLLAPVRDEVDAERGWVKQEAARLSSQVRVERLDPWMARSSSLRGIVLPLPEMHAMVREAVDLANRWLRLSASRPNQGLFIIPQEAEDLRAEVLRRTDPVLMELAECFEGNRDPMVQAGATQLYNTVQRIRRMMKWEESLPVRERELPHLIFGDLLKIPSLALNDEWKPDATPEVIEHEILSYLEHGEISWKEAFEKQTELRDHTATRRMLEIPVWSESERIELANYRQAQLISLRQQFSDRVDKLLQSCQEAREKSAISQDEFIQAESRLKRVAGSLQYLEDFPSIQMQLEQLHLRLSSRVDGGLAEPIAAVRSTRPTRMDQPSRRPEDGDDSGTWVMDIFN